MTWLLIFVIWGLIWGKASYRRSRKKVKKPETNKEEISVWFWRRTVLYKFLIVRCDFWWSNGGEMRATDSRGWLCLFFLNWFFFVLIMAWCLIWWSNLWLLPHEFCISAGSFPALQRKKIHWQARGNNNNNRAKIIIKK